jgi:hypothetical protein
MTRTLQFGLPLIAPAQAQKHVTVNEALSRLDAVAQLRVVSSGIIAPPVDALPGSAYLVPEGGSGEWEGQFGKIAVAINGGWELVAPKAGWRLWDEEAWRYRQFDGTGWIDDAISVTENGAAAKWITLEFEHAITPGTTNFSQMPIPSHSILFGLTGRVTEAITGTGLTTWRIGVEGGDNRYGTGLGTALNSYLVGLSGAPITYYADTPLLLTAEAGAFEGGRLVISMSLLSFRAPRAVKV